MMTFDEIINLLNVGVEESRSFIPNEVFDELQEAVDTGHIHNVSHMTFAYSYIYLTQWLYRHCKHEVIDMNTKDRVYIDNGKMKEILGSNAKYKPLDYLTKCTKKEVGVLEQMKWIETTADYPIMWYPEDSKRDNAFHMFSEYAEEMEYYDTAYDKPPHKFTIKKPTRAFHRFINKEEYQDCDYENDYPDSIFNGVIEKTHEVSFLVFAFCMSNKDIGTTGFYLYSYLKMMNDRYEGGWDCSVDKMIKLTGLPEKTLKRYLDALRKHKMVLGIANQDVWSKALKPSERKANTYITNEIKKFSWTPVDYTKIKVLTVSEYYKEYGKPEEDQVEKLEFDLDSLPF